METHFALFVFSALGPALLPQVARADGEVPPVLHCFGTDSGSDNTVLMIHEKLSGRFGRERTFYEGSFTRATSDRHFRYIAKAEVYQPGKYTLRIEITNLASGGVTQASGYSVPVDVSAAESEKCLADEPLGCFTQLRCELR